MDNANIVLPDDKAALWITGYFPNGMKASFTVAVSLQTAFAEGMEFTNRLLEQGFTVNPPGLADGENKFIVARVVRREKYDDRRRRNVAILDLYSENGKFREMGVYLNETADEAAFEQVAGIKLASLPLCENEVPFKLDGDMTKASKYLRTLPRPIVAIRKQNPHYDPTAEKKKAKWDFVRWEAANGKPAPAHVDVATGEVTGNPAPSDWTNENAKAIVDKYGKDTVREALGIQHKLSEWGGSVAEAEFQIDLHLKGKELADVPF